MEKLLKNKSLESRFLKNYVAALLLWATVQLAAQVPQSVSRMPVVEETAAAAALVKNISVGLNLGLSNGIGIDVAYKFSKKLSARLAYNYAAYAYNDYQYTLQTKSSDPADAKPQTFSFDMAANFSNLQLGVEYAPGAKGRFRLMGGLSYFPTNNLTGSGELASVIRFKDVELNAEDVGKGSVRMGFAAPVAPYLGIGLGRLHPRKRLNVSIDMGAYYKGNYTFDVDVSEGGLIQKENEDNAAVLEKNFNAKLLHKIWPIMNLRIAYRLR